MSIYTGPASVRRTSCHLQTPKRPDQRSNIGVTLSVGLSGDLDLHEVHPGEKKNLFLSIIPNCHCLVFSFQGFNSKAVRERCLRQERPFLPRCQVTFAGSRSSRTKAWTSSGVRVPGSDLLIPRCWDEGRKEK